MVVQNFKHFNGDSHHASGSGNEPEPMTAREPDKGEETNSPRTVLLLQGLMGRVFRRLGQELIKSGHKVYKVNFNGGDRLFWRLPGGIEYRKPLDEWPDTLRTIIAE